MKIVELDRISKAYDTKIAVHELSFDIEAGSMFGLLGPNGAGKTSAIRMMIGMTLPDSGSVKLFGQPFTRKSLARVGYLPEERGLYKKMKVLDQLVLMGQLRGLTAAQAASRARQWCERLDIADSIDKKTEELSKGMQQKIQFIAAILHDPELMIMDEPFSGLDPVNTVLLQDVLVELQRQGKAVLFSTHQMHQVERLCDTICLVNRGIATLSGNMREIKSRYPRNRLRVGFAGDDAFLTSPFIAESKITELQIGEPKPEAGQANGSAALRMADIRLKDGADPQAILSSAMSSARVSHFEVVEPTLEEIFIETVQGDLEGKLGGKVGGKIDA